MTVAMVFLSDIGKGAKRAKYAVWGIPDILMKGYPDNSITKQLKLHNH